MRPTSTLAVNLLSVERKAGEVQKARRNMAIEDKMVNLAPGMAVTVEVKTGQRRIIEYVMSPLLRYKQESLRER
jgi:hemolysin D